MVLTVINKGANPEDDEAGGSRQRQKSTKTKAGGGFWNLDLELQAIKTMLTPSSEWATKVYAVCKPEYFHQSTTKAVFKRLQTVMGASKSFALPTLDFVLADPKISPAIRQTLRDAFDDEEHPIAIVGSQGDYDLIIQELSSLAKTRALYDATHSAATELLDSEEPSSLIMQVTNQLGASLFKIEDNEDSLTQVMMGTGYNQAAEDTFNRIVNGSFDGIRVKTGFQEFDERTGGFHRTNLVIIGAGSGHGKSLLALNLLRRQYALGYNVVLASYEMVEDECLIRLLSNISEVPMTAIQNNRTTPEEMTRLNAAWREFNLLGHEKRNYYSLICPRRETTVSEIGFRVRGMKPDVVILDYINLLTTASSATSETAQWQKLGDISRESKLLANKLNCVVILLAQIDDTYNLRYSKGIKDHANFVMGFIRDELSKNNRTIEINQMKARNAPLYNFTLVERFDIAQFRDPDQQDRIEWPTPDELMMLELRCQSLGLKLEPTASKEFDKKKAIEAKQSVNSIDVEIISEADGQEPLRLDDEERAAPAASLLFSSEDAIPVDFSKLEVKASPVSLLTNDSLYEDTV